LFVSCAAMEAVHLHLNVTLVEPFGLEAVINWGDGESLEASLGASGSFAYQHMYTTPGSYGVIVESKNVNDTERLGECASSSVFDIRLDPVNVIPGNLLA